MKLDFISEWHVKHVKLHVIWLALCKMRGFKSLMYDGEMIFSGWDHLGWLIVMEACRVNLATAISKLKVMNIYAMIQESVEQLKNATRLIMDFLLKYYVKVLITPRAF